MVGAVHRYDSPQGLSVVEDHGRKQSVLNDAWATSAQVISFPPLEMTQWDISSPARDTLIEELKRCEDVMVQMSVEFVRALPKVGEPAWREA